MSDSFLPPAVLDLIVNAAQWNSVLDEATAPLEAVNELMAEASAAAGDMGAAMGASAGEVAASAGEAAASLDGYSEAVLTAARAGGSLAAANARLAGAQQAYKDATAAAADASKALADAQAAGGTQTDAYAVAMDRSAAAIQAQAGALTELKAAQAEAATATKAATAASKEAGTVAQESSAKTSGGMKLWAVAAAAGIAISVKMAGDFQQSMTRLVTSAGETKGNLGLVSQGILAMSSATNTSTSQLASGMYQVESAGFHGAAGLTVMKAAAQGAQAEGADLATVASALTSGLNAYGLKANQATSFTNQMLAVVGEGKMTFQELAGSLSAVLPIAAANGISFAQVGGALATMTSMGVSAREGSQELANTIRNLGKPSNVAVNEMNQLGISSVNIQQHLGQRGLTGTIGILANAVKDKMGPSGLVAFNAFNKSASAAQDASTMLSKLPPSIQGVAKAYLAGTASYTTWNKATKTLGLASRTMADQFASTAGKAHGFNNMLTAGVPGVQTFAGAMSNMLGGATGLNTALMLTGNHAKTFKDNAKGAADAAKGAGSNVKGWGDIQSTFNFQLGSAEKAAQAMAISFGTALLPAATKVMKVFAEVAGFFAKNAAASKVLAVVIGVLLAGALEHGLAKALKTCVSGLSEMTGAGKAAIGFFRSGEGEASQFSKVLSGIGSGGKAAWSGLQAAGSAISGAFSAAGSGIGSAVTAVKNWGIWSQIASGATKAWTGIQWAFNAAMDAMPVIAIVLAIAALVAGIIYAYTHFKTFRDIVNDVGRAIKGGFLDALHAVEKAVGEVVGFVKSHWVLIVGFILGPIALVAALIYTHWNTVKHIFDEAWGFIKNLVKRDVHEVETILGWFGSLPGKMRGWWDRAVSAVESEVSRLLGGVRAIPGRILSGLGNLGHLLFSAGQHVIDGLISGVESMFGSLGSVAGSIGSHLLGGVKDVLGIFSPSKAFYGIGVNITSGLSLGITQTSAQVLSKARTLAAEVARAAAEGTITAAQASELSARLSAGLRAALRQSIGQALGPGLQQELVTTGKITKASLAALVQIWDAARGGLISRSEASGLAKWVKADNVRLNTLAKERSKIAGEIAAAKAFASSTASAAESAYSLTAAAGTGTAPASVKSIISSLQGDVGKIRRFAANIKKLAKEGLNKAYLGQIIAMGPDQGGALAAELAAAGLGDIRQINAAEAGITAASNGLGYAAANVMYDSGKQAGKGFLSGLKAQQAAIEKVMAEIAAAMVKRLRKDLGISSPSKVFFLHGQAIAQGLALGIASGVGQVARAVGGLSAATSLAGTRSTVPAGVLSAGGSQPIVINLNNKVTGEMNGKAVYEAVQEQTFHYNIRNSGQVTGALRPGT